MHRDKNSFLRDKVHSYVFQGMAILPTTVTLLHNHRREIVMLERNNDLFVAPGREREITDRSKNSGESNNTREM